MGLFSKDIETMDDLLLHGLKDIYYAENQIVKSLPKLIEKATNRDLSKGLKDHLEETTKQVGRLDQVFRMLGQEPKGVKCPAIDGLISEADDLAGEVADKDVLDAAIVGSAQAVEHYEIARYGTLIAWAESLGRDDIVRLFTTNLNEEKAADKKLSTVALAERRQPQGRKLRCKRRSEAAPLRPNRSGAPLRDQGCSYGRNRMSKVWIGTSGWTYDGWRGPFYPSESGEEELAVLLQPSVPDRRDQRVVLSHAVAGGREGVARPDPGDFSVRMEGVEVHHSLEATERELREFAARVAPLKTARMSISSNL